MIHRRVAEDPEPPERIVPAEPDWLGPRPCLVRSSGGRADESVRPAGLLAAARLVTVTGVGGCGKTALASRVAHDSARRTGAAVVAMALATVTSAEQIVHAMAELLGATDGGTDIGGALASAERVPATSRQPSGVAGEAVFALEPLPVPVPDEPAAATLGVPSSASTSSRPRGSPQWTQVSVRRAGSALPA